MKNHFPLLSTVFVLTAVCGVANADAPPVASAGVAAGYKVPTLVVPYAAHKPTIDGVIDDNEWRGAVSLNALQTTNHAVSPRQTRFYLTWDEENLYLAMRSPLRPGEKPIEALRDRSRDVNAVFDDSYEVWLDVGSHYPDGQPVFFQYLGNFAGARTDVLQEPAAGNSRPSWTAGWKPSNRLTRVTPDGRFWEMEVAIPRRSLLKETPFADGFTFSALMTRNFKRPWDQVSVSGSGSFSVRETYARFTLARGNTPAVQLLAVADPEKRTFGFAFAATGAAKPETLHWRFVSDSGIRREGDLAVVPGKTTISSPLLNLDGPGDGNFRITVTGNGGTRTLLDWSARRQWGDLAALTEKIDDRGDAVDLTLAYNPAHDYLRVTGDFIHYDARAAIAQYVVVVRSADGRTLTSQKLTLDSLDYVRGVIHLPPLSPGEYSARLTALDSSGKELFRRESPFVQKNAQQVFPWWNTHIGDIEKVIAPWTPVCYTPASGHIDVWGRGMEIGVAGLPRRITTQKRDMLADGGAYLEAVLGDGRTVRATGTTHTLVSHAKHRAIVQTISHLGNTIAVSSRVTAEFDGMYRVDLTLTPAKPTTLRALTVVVPLRKETAAYLHACGEGIRYGFDARFLPKEKTGRLWDSRAVDGQPMLVGSFIPYVWIGDIAGGLCWFADSDEGWFPSDKTPALEVRRVSAAGNTNLLLHLVSAPITLTAPRTITFAFQATPVRPLQPGWRMDTWWTNDSFKDWAQVESEGKAGNMGLIFSSLPFPLNPAKSQQMVEERHKQTNAIFGLDKYRANAVPYFEHINMGEKFAPDLSYFGDEWRTHVSRGLAYGQTLQDFMIWNLSHWIDQAGIDGFYVDNVFPIADDNVESGRGYRLPDGRVQPTYQMFDTRRYFLRMRAAFAEKGKNGKIVLHMTNHLIAPWLGAADIALDGEHHVIFPEMGKDFMDFWSPERLRMDSPAQWGVPVNFLQEHQGAWDRAVLKRAMRAYTGILLLNDVLASANANSLNQEVWQARDRFGIEADDVRFHGFWEPDSGFGTTTPGISVSGWTRPGKALGQGKLLLVVVNAGEDTVCAAIHLDPAKLGLPSPSSWQVRDAETLESLSTDSQGRIIVPVNRHDYRQVRIDPLSSE